MGHTGFRLLLLSSKRTRKKGSGCKSFPQRNGMVAPTNVGADPHHGYSCPNTLYDELLPRVISWSTPHLAGRLSLLTQSGRDGMCTIPLHVVSPPTIVLDAPKMVVHLASHSDNMRRTQWLVSHQPLAGMSNGYRPERQPWQRHAHAYHKALRGGCQYSWCWGDVKCRPYS